METGFSISPMQPSKRPLESMDAGATEPERKKFQSTMDAAVRKSCLQDPALLEVVSKFRSISVQEIRRLKESGVDAPKAIDCLLKKLRAYDQPIETTGGTETISPSLEEVAAQFLPEEIELVMELAGSKDRAGAARILILREEIYKLRKEGFDSSSIVEVLMQRISKPATVTGKREQPPREFPRETKRQKSEQNSVSPFVPTASGQRSVLLTPTTQSPSTSSSAFVSSALPTTSFEMLLSDSDTAPSALEKMRRLKQMRKARLLLQFEGSDSKEQASTHLLKRAGDQTSLYSERMRAIKKLKTDFSVPPSSLPSPTSASTSSSSSPLVISSPGPSTTSSSVATSSSAAPALPFSFSLSSLTTTRTGGL